MVVCGLPVFVSYLLGNSDHLSIFVIVGQNFDVSSENSSFLCVTLSSETVCSFNSSWNKELQPRIGSPKDMR